MIDSPATIFKNIILECYPRETDMPLSMNGNISHFDDDALVMVDVDFFVLFSNQIIRLEIAHLNRYGIQSNNRDTIDKVLLQGYESLNASGEFDTIMAMRLYL